MFFGNGSLTEYHDKKKNIERVNAFMLLRVWVWFALSHAIKIGRMIGYTGIKTWFEIDIMAKH